jgi:glucosamine kinase
MSPTGAAPRDILVGVDGGGTKTLVRIEDRDGRQLGHGQGGPANVQHSVEGSWRSILDAVGKALAQAGLSLDDRRHRLFCGAGLAGTEVVSAHDRFLATPHPFARLIVKSDGYISCLGAHDGRDGMVIAIGTGTIAFQIEDGREERAGGWASRMATRAAGLGSGSRRCASPSTPSTVAPSPRRSPMPSSTASTATSTGWSASPPGPTPPSSRRSRRW